MKLLRKLVRLPKALRLGFMLESASTALARDQNTKALIAARKVITSSGDAYFEPRMIEVMALYYVGQTDQSAESFRAAIDLIASDKKLSEPEKNYLTLYALAHFKERVIPPAFRGVEIPDFPDLNRVSARIKQKYPFKDS